MKSIREIVRHNAPLAEAFRQFASQPDFEIKGLPQTINEGPFAGQSVLAVYFKDNISKKQPHTEPLLAFLPKEFYEGCHVCLGQAVVPPEYDTIVQEAAIRRRSEHGYQSSFIVAEYETPFSQHFR